MALSPDSAIQSARMVTALMLKVPMKIGGLGDQRMELKFWINEERDFRLWEKKLGFFRNTFKNVQPLLMLDEVKTTNTEVVKSVLIRNNSEEYANLLKSSILCEKGVIKNDKLILLVFLSTIHTVNRGDNAVYCDKALFLFSLINKPDVPLISITGVPPFWESSIPDTPTRKVFVTGL